MKVSAPTGFYALEGYAATAEVLVELTKSASADESKTLLKASREAARCLQKFAQVFAIGTPRSLVIKGRVDELGRQGSGQKAFEQAGVAAQTLQMPLEESRARAFITSQSQ